MQIVAINMGNLKIAKFKNVAQLIVNTYFLKQLYFTNPEADQIQINNIQFFGTQSQKMDFSQIKNVNL